MTDASRIQAMTKRTALRDTNRNAKAIVDIAAEKSERDDAEVIILRHPEFNHRRGIVLEAPISN
jgi:hypothetical protein